MESSSSIGPNRLGFLIEEIDQNSSILPSYSSSDANSSFLPSSISMSDFELAEEDVSYSLDYEANDDEAVADENEVVDIVADENEDVIADNVNEAESPRINGIPAHHFSPSGTRVLWIPEDVVRPKTKTVYKTIDAGVAMYKAYAKRAAFDTRMGSVKYKEKIVTHRYVFCNRQGFSQSVYVDTTDETKNKLHRNSNIKRRGCPAFAKFSRVGNSDKFKLYRFCEEHNHPLIKPELRHFLKANRQLDYTTRVFLDKLARLNIGPTRAYRIIQELRGSFNLDGGTVIDYKNEAKKVNCFMEEDDAQMLVDKYLGKKKINPTLTFEFICDKRVLTSVFWADEAAKANYREFGDIVSFDATFRTNKYRMVFVPFTGIDNHNKSVTFGVGLLSNETIASYEWLLKTFLRTFEKAPVVVVVTDEDAAMKVAVSRVFPLSRHRLCMWHIVSKIPAKVCAQLSHDNDFKRRFNRLVWHPRIDRDVFDARWKQLVEDFKLQENTWFSKMYDLRDMWIPAYFREMPLSGLMRTASRPESTNAAFGKTAHWGNNLIKFFSSLESTMDRQRHNQCFLDHTSNTSTIKAKLSLKIIEHASKVYTHAIFKKVLHEIEESFYSCSQDSATREELVDMLVVMELRDSIKETDKVLDFEDNADMCEKFLDCEDNEVEPDITLPEKPYYFKVVYDKKESTFECYCRLFERCGILCRHIFCIFRSYRIEKIPSKYILRRWSKDVIPSEVLLKKSSSDEASTSSDSLSHKLLSFVEESVASFSKNEDKLSEFFELIKDAKIKVDGVSSVSSSSGSTIQKQSFTEFVESSYGIKKPTVKEIENPADISNKGSGTGKRLCGAREKVIVEAVKQKRLCTGCNQYVTGHNRRTCPVAAAAKGKGKEAAPK